MEYLDQIFRLLGQEYESNYEVYGRGGKQILQPGDTFILRSINDDGLCSIIKTGHFPSEIKKISWDDLIWIEYEYLEGSEATGRFLVDEERIGLGRPGKPALPSLAF